MPTKPAKRGVSAKRAGARAPKTAAAPPDARARILDAAKALFAEFGVGATSIADIARAAKVSKANVFHHFGTKEALHLDIVRSLTERGSQVFELLGENDADAAQRLQRFTQAHLSAIMQDPVGTRMMLGELLSNSPQHIRYLAEEFFERDFQQLVAMIAQAQAQPPEAGGWRRDMDPAAVALVLLSAQVFFFQAQPIIQHFRSVGFAQQPDLYGASLVDLMLNGLRPRDLPTTPQSS